MAWSFPVEYEPGQATGDLMYLTVSTDKGKTDLVGVAIGAEGTVLTVSSGVPAWASGAVSVGGSNGQLQYNSSGTFDGANGTSWDDTNRTLNWTGSTLTSSDPLIDATQTWNSGATTFDAFVIDVTSTSSASASRLMSLKVGGTSVFSVRKDGTVNAAIDFTVAGVTYLDSILGNTQGSVAYRGASAWTSLPPGTSGHFLKTQGAAANPTWAAVPSTPAGSNTEIQFNNAGSFGASSNLVWTGTAFNVGSSILLGWSDVYWSRIASTEMGLVNSTNSQKLHIYHTYAGAGADYERIGLYGTGAADEFWVEIVSAGTGRDNLDLRLVPEGTGGVIIGLTGSSAKLYFDQKTSSAPMFKRSSTDLHLRLGDDSGYASLRVNELVLNENIYFDTNGAGILEMGKESIGTHEFRAYADYTDTSNYEGWRFVTDTGVGTEIGTLTAGTGTDDLHLTLKPSGAGAVRIKQGSNTQYLQILHLTELTVIAAAATTDTTIQAPANSLVVGVTVRVTTTIPTATTFDVGIAGATTRYGTGISTSANTTNSSPGTTNPTIYASATSIRITPNATPGANTGRVRVTIHYLIATAPTS